MQRRDVETEDKGASGRKHSIRQASKHQHRACRSLQACSRVVCRWSAASAVCSRCGGSRIAASCSSLVSSSVVVGLSPCLFFRHVVILQSQHMGCQHAPQTLPRSSDWPSMPSQGHNHNSSMRLLIRRSANNQRGGLAVRKRLASKLLAPCHVLTAAVGPGRIKQPSSRSSSPPSPSLMGFPNAANHAGSGTAKPGTLPWASSFGRRRCVCMCSRHFLAVL